LDLISLKNWESFKLNDEKLIPFLNSSLENKNFKLEIVDRNKLNIIFITKNEFGLIFDFTLSFNNSGNYNPNSFEQFFSTFKYFIRNIDLKFQILLEGSKVGINSKVEDLNTEIKNIKYGKKINFEFLPNIDNSYEVSKINKTIKLKKGGAWLGIRGDRMIQNCGKYHFSFKIIKTDTNCHIIAGFCVTETNHINGFYFQKNNLMFYFHNGYWYINGSAIKKGNFSRGKQGDIYKLVIDLDKKLIYLYQNNEELEFHPITFEISGLKFSPCIDLVTGEDSITIIDE